MNFSGGLSVVTKVLVSEGGKKELRVRENEITVEVEVGMTQLLALQKERGHKPRLQVAATNQKRQENRISLGVSRRHTAQLILRFSHNEMHFRSLTSR